VTTVCFAPNCENEVAHVLAAFQAGLAKITL